MSAKWIKSRRAQLMEPKGYSPPQELEKAREAGYFSTLVNKNIRPNDEKIRSIRLMPLEFFMK